MRAVNNGMNTFYFVVPIDTDVTGANAAVPYSLNRKSLSLVRSDSHLYSRLKMPYALTNLSALAPAA